MCWEFLLFLIFEEFGEEEIGFGFDFCVFAIGMKELEISVSGFGVWKRCLRISRFGAMHVIEKVGRGLSCGVRKFCVAVDFCGTVVRVWSLLQLAGLHHSVGFREEELVSCLLASLPFDRIQVRSIPFHSL